MLHWTFDLQEPMGGVTKMFAPLPVEQVQFLRQRRCPVMEFTSPRRGEVIPKLCRDQSPEGEC